MKNYWKSNRIRLRAFEEEDIQKYILERKEPDSLRQWYEDYIEPPQSERGIKEALEEYLLDFKSKDRHLFVIENLEGEYVGEISIWYTHRRNGVFRYGIFMDESKRGFGYGKEALIIVLDFYFNELNYQKCSPTVYSFNENSQKFHEKFGFKLEGRLRNDVYTRGKYFDMLYYGMLKEEFNERYHHHF